MKVQLARLVTLCFLAPSFLYGQGTLVFNNRVTPVGLDAPVYLGRIGGPGPGPDYSAGLYVVRGSELKFLSQSVVSFRDPAGANPLLAHYINGRTVVVPGTATGQSVTVRMRAWLTSAGSYEAAHASQRGESMDLVAAELGGGPDPSWDNFLPSDFSGFVIGEGFDFTANGGNIPGGDGVTTPEPSVWALGAFGLVCLAFRARKR